MPIDPIIFGERPALGRVPLIGGTPLRGSIAVEGKLIVVTDGKTLMRFNRAAALELLARLPKLIEQLPQT